MDHTWQLRSNFHKVQVTLFWVSILTCWRICYTLRGWKIALLHCSVWKPVVWFFLHLKHCNMYFFWYTALLPLGIIGDCIICRGPGWLLGLMGVPLGPVLPCMAFWWPGPGAPIGGAEAGPTQPSCCCMPGRGPLGAISAGGTHTNEKNLRTDFSRCPLPPWCYIRRKD